MYMEITFQLQIEPSLPLHSDGISTGDYLNMFEQLLVTDGTNAARMNIQQHIYFSF